MLIGGYSLSVIVSSSSFLTELLLPIFKSFLDLWEIKREREKERKKR